MEEAKHRHLRDELLGAAAEPVKDMVSLHLEWCVGHRAAASTPARSGSITRREDTAELLLRVLHCAMRAANISRVGKPNEVRACSRDFRQIFESWSTPKFGKVARTISPAEREK
jgi:hypothetical protein